MNTQQAIAAIKEIGFNAVCDRVTGELNRDLSAAQIKDRVLATMGGAFNAFKVMGVAISADDLQYADAEVLDSVMQQFVAI